jgi:hypothetical protein
MQRSALAALALCKARPKHQTGRWHPHRPLHHGSVERAAGAFEIRARQPGPHLSIMRLASPRGSVGSSAPRLRPPPPPPLPPLSLPPPLEDLRGREGGIQGSGPHASPAGLLLRRLWVRLHRRLPQPLHRRCRCPCDARAITIARPATAAAAPGPAAALAAVPAAAAADAGPGLLRMAPKSAGVGGH